MHVAFGRRPRRALRCAVAAAGGLVALFACGAPRYHYVKNTSEQTFVRVPHDWTLYDEDELLATSEESPEAKEQFKQLTWSVAFDASPKPSLAHVLSVADHPTGLVQVRRLLPSQRDTFSLSDLRSVLLRFDPLSDEAQQEEAVEVLRSRDVTRPGGLHGSELLLNLRTPDGEVVKWHQVALVDSRVSKVHLLAVSCEDACYNANRKVIDEVIDSWKVKER